MKSRPIIEVDAAEKALVASSRARMYRLLSSLFIAPPNPPLLKALGKLTSPKEKLYFDEKLSDEMTRGMERLGTFAEITEKQRLEDVSTEIPVEFTHLFRGIRKGRKPPL